MPKLHGDRSNFVLRKGARLAAVFLGGTLCHGVAQAGSIDLGGDASLDYKLTVSYAMALPVRTAMAYDTVSL